MEFEIMSHDGKIKYYYESNDEKRHYKCELDDDELNDRIKDFFDDKMRNEVLT